MKKHYYSKLMEYILLFIHITQNSQSALFHDAKIPNLALFRESKIPNMRGTGPIPNEAKKIAAQLILIMHNFEINKSFRLLVLFGNRYMASKLKSCIVMV